MEPTAHNIEIFRPFGEAYELTKKILFQPFSFTKWLVIGFAAWLATFFSGGRFTQRHRLSHADWNWQAYHAGNWSLHDVPLWVIPFGIIGLLCVLAVGVLFLWLNSRGHFLFTDCIVRNRAAIAEPWREYRQEGNSLFLFQLAVMVGILLLVVALAVAVIPLYWAQGWNALTVLVLSLFALVLFLLAFIINFLERLMVAVMYRRRCGAREGFRAVWNLVLAQPGNFIVCLLFLCVLYLAAMAIGCIAGCVTCCIATLPYIGTVILLPVVMVLYAFPLCFIRQFGDSYDVWAGAAPVMPPPMQIPPVQEDLPPSP